MNVALLGAGSWAIALAVLLHKRKHTITMWEYNAQEAQMLSQKREHPLKLPGIIIPPDVVITNSIPQALQDADFVVCAVPSQTMRSTMRAVTAQCSGAVLQKIQAWIIVSKGIELNSLELMTDVLLEELPQDNKQKLVVLSGPSHAEEVSRDVPTTVVAASYDQELAAILQQEFSTETFRIYTNSDITGVELAASVKNIIALSAGICDGLGLGDNTKGALLTRGLVEMIRLGMKMGAREETFYGLAGMGDLITTCMSKHSRNRRFGELIGQGHTLQEALGQMVMVAEGVETTRSVYQLAQRHDVEMPITQEVYRTLFEGKCPRQAVRDLMQRESKPERHDEPQG